jgi:nucleoside-diphosphate-sugar epimerase
MRIVVTGSKGRLGSAVVAYAQAQGADVLGVDQVGVGNLSDYIVADLTDVGQVYDVLHGADAVIHLAAIPHARRFTSARTLSNNVTSGYNVLLGAQHLGIRRVVMASSIQVMHRAGYHARARFQYLPLDEAHPPDPKDEYGLSKLMLEQAAEMFAHHYDMTTVSLRYVWVCPADDWASLPQKPPPDDAIDPLPFCVHSEDAARAAWLAATAPLPANTHTVAFIAAPDIRFDMDTSDFLRKFYPNVTLRTAFKSRETLVSLKRAEEAFGFVPKYRCHSEAEGRGIP